MTALRCILAAVMALGTGAASAHDITIFPVQAENKVHLEFRYGDPGGYEPIEKVRFVEVSVFDAKDVKINFTRDVTRVPDDMRKAVTTDLRLGDWPAGTYVVSGRYDNGFYIHDGENRAVATTKEWFPTAIDSAHYLKFSKALFHVGPSSAGFDRVLGHRLEVVPLADPFAAKIGTVIPLRVLFDGAPLPGHIVEIGDDKAASLGGEVRTDGNGIAKLPLAHKGYFRISVDHRAPSKYPELYAFDDYTASLVFER